ncbi:putative Zinc-binding alcohol dehydrogenase domain-containing protein cipB [Glarea lozoyensis 74030]|uniref:Putative Zinc-binding alcohol dehydrogenase domain-containing protein cipB n=1 Tax=Glarea lozoyensis (strain ATCC 74030 / MF5533) TaxID=1104152 RepID=H0ESF3_GLAL7|nr:putative Zinc-binding alcohol dehydrogenase domain-containing protein cipB [Glarea lozoyensis 74030]
MPPSNTAAWITAEKANPLELKPAPYVQPAANQIVIKNLAVALNLVDWSRQDLGASLFGWTKYPAIFGSDVSGTVEKVGSSVTRLKLGDRVVAHADETTNNDPSQGAFQNYVVVDSHMASRIPDSLSYESASVIPLYPSASISFVTTEASNRQDASRLEWCIGTLKDKTMAGGFAVGNGSPTPVIEIISKLNGTKFVASANPNIGSPPPDDIGFKFVFGTSLRENEVGPAIYENFLTKALADGTFLAKPDADVVGHGLSDIQKGLDILKKGVSAKKIVISLA